MSGSPSTKNPLIQGTQIVTCPKCNAEFECRRSIRPHIDECGFESYDLECVTCAASLRGIIDPGDDKLLLSETESPKLDDDCRSFRGRHSTISADDV